MLTSTTACGIWMDTFVSVEVTHEEGMLCAAAVDRALAAFEEVEHCCSRFDEASELNLVTAVVGRPIAPSATVFAAIDYALEMATATDGAFDPTVGASMEARGFDREYRTGQSVRHGRLSGSYHDIEIDRRNRTITMKRPLRVDLGAVAKGLAIDLAAQELRQFPGCLVYAGGDIYARGINHENQPWTVGIRDPREHQQIVRHVRLDDAAVCTSGDYERRDQQGGGHILDPHTGRPASQFRSVSVVASSAMRADALATAAFVLGPHASDPLLCRYGAAAMFVDGEGNCRDCNGFASLSHDVALQI